MSVAFTYRLLRYVHDPAAGETLNVGVVLHAPVPSYLGSMVDTHYERLSNTFSNFDGEHFRLVLRRFERAIDVFREQQLNVLPLASAPESVEQITRQLWPDDDLSFSFGPVLAGITSSPEDELAAIFDRMVLSQYPKGEKVRRTDEDVWSLYKRPLSDKALTSVLRPKTIATKDFELMFPYAFENEKWHVLQPLSLDFTRPEGIQRKAAQWLGNCTALGGNTELSQVYLLLGQPQLQAHSAAYERAKRVLDKIPLAHEIVEEDGAADFAEELRRYMKKHSVIPNTRNRHS